MATVADGAREIQLRVTPEVAAELERQAEIMQGAAWRPSSKWTRSDAVLEVLERGTRIVLRGDVLPEDWPPKTCTEPITVVVSTRWWTNVREVSTQHRISLASAYRRILNAGLLPNRKALMRREDSLTA